jgi:hypothetical protein
LPRQRLLHHLVTIFPQGCLLHDIAAV